VTRGATDREVVLPYLPTFAIYADGDPAEATLISVGQDTSPTITDWICTNMEPLDEARARISGVVYRPGIYAGTLPHQQTDGSIDPLTP
jgi:hypothetical protein